MYHIAFMSGENETKRCIKIPQKPPMFCMLLRKYLDGARIADAKVVENERIFELIFETYDELSQKRALCLCVELMGKHSNVILYDKDTRIIIGCAHNVGSEKSRYRELQGGLKYTYPPSSKNLMSNELKEQFKNLPYEKINEYLTSENYTPAVKDERYTLFRELIEGSVPQNSVNEMLDNYYAYYQEQFILKSEKSKLTEIAGQKLKKTKNAVSKIETLLKKRDNTEKYKLYGELLTANLYQKKDFSKSIEVLNYNTGENIIIELDETKTLNENAQRYYKLYTKAKNTKEKSKEMLNNLNIEKEYLENILYSIGVAGAVADLEDIKQELNIPDEKPKKQNKGMEIERVNIGGYDVYIGKNNKQNDYIISKLAKDEDIWFHTRLCAGSHILLKAGVGVNGVNGIGLDFETTSSNAKGAGVGVNGINSVGLDSEPTSSNAKGVNGIGFEPARSNARGGSEPPEEVIFECCKLARKYSSASQPSKIGVIYTKAKNLRKPPAAPLGYVTYKNEKEVLV